MASPNTKRDEKLTSTDLYNTPVEALDALCKVVQFDKNKTYFEPCNGLGKIKDYFQDKLDIKMITNELNGYGTPDYEQDFINVNPLAAECWNFDTIVTNPPYKIGKEFVLEGFKYAKDQYHLLRGSFIEGQERYEDLFSLGHLKTLYVFTYRISCTKGEDEGKTENSVAYCWYHFDRDYVGDPKIVWLTK